MNTIIFLDIDGVLNQLQPNYYLDNNCIKILAEIKEKLQAEIVLTSSWRLGFTHSYDRCTPQIQNLINRFRQYGIKIKSRTRQLGDRTTEIKTYIHENEVDNYIILDDDESEHTDYTNIYIVNSKTGLTKYDIKKILKLMR